MFDLADEDGNAWQGLHCYGVDAIVLEEAPLRGGTRWGKTGRDGWVEYARQAGSPRIDNVKYSFSGRLACHGNLETREAVGVWSVGEASTVADADSSYISDGFGAAYDRAETVEVGDVSGAPGASQQPRPRGGRAARMRTTAASRRQASSTSSPGRAGSSSGRRWATRS